MYARRGPLPVLTTTDVDDGIELAWTNVDDLDFPMPVPVRMNGEISRVEFAGNKARLPGYSSTDIQIDPYLQVLRKLSIVPTCEERRAEEAAAAAES